MQVVIRFALSLIFALAPAAWLAAQEKSVRPGINDSFRDPNVAEFAGRFEVESREVFAKRREIVAACRLQPGLTVADIGAGTGLFTRPFAEAVGAEGRVIAVDISQNFLDHVARTSLEAGYRNVETLLCKPDSTELPAGAVDVAFICDTYHHFEFPLRTMASLNRALKPNGRVILIDFRRIPGKSSEFVMNHVRAGQEVVESEIVQAGFRKTGEQEGLLAENYLVEFTKSSSPGLRALEFPVVAGFGGIVPLRAAAEPPRTGAKVVFEITADSSPEGVNKGLERAARLLNLYGSAGLSASDVKIALALHGEATKAVLVDSFYGVRFGVESNPNLPLIRELKKAGVEVFVCRQALNTRGFAESAVAPDVTIAAAALTVVMNKQAEGYGYLLVP
jgi:ubiquinone/menaquinone biosynthesis C-methylase UbiE/intracellular sulfur oxidation DsrE/DsrF family protein